MCASRVGVLNIFVCFCCFDVQGVGDVKCWRVLLVCGAREGVAL